MKNSISIAYNGWRWFSFTMRHSKVNLQCTFIIYYFDK